MSFNRGGAEHVLSDTITMAASETERAHNVQCSYYRNKTEKVAYLKVLIKGRH